MTATKLSLIDEKIADITKQESVMKVRNITDPTDPTYISKNTRGTQLYHMGRDKRTLHLIRSLVEAAGEDVKLSADDMDTLVLITTLSSERSSTRYVIEAGMKVIDVLMKYPNLNGKTLRERLEKLNLKMEGDTIVEA